MPVVDIVYVNLYFMLVCLMTRGRVGSVLGGGSEDELPAVLAKWRGLDYPPFIPAKSPGFCLTLVIPSLWHIQQVLRKRTR